jgi:hypothetical protein
MARSRTIKPSFFTNEELAELSRDVRLFFEGLWIMADREGRLENRPKRIKREVFPYDADFTEATVGEWLSVLANSRGRFITLYEVNGEKYIQIKNFKKHQDIHPREKASEIPVQPKADPVPAITVQGSPNPDEAGTRNVIIPLPSCTSVPSGSLPLSSLSASDPDQTHDPSSTTTVTKGATDWLSYFTSKYFVAHGRQYGQGEGDSKATGKLHDLLESLPDEQRAADWAVRERMVTEFLCRTDPRTVGTGWSFSFFVQDFRGLAIPPEKRPKPEPRPNGYDRPMRQAIYPVLKKATQ